MIVNSTASNEVEKTVAALKFRTEKPVAHIAPPEAKAAELTGKSFEAVILLVIEL